MDILFCVLYFVGVIVTFIFNEKEISEYEQTHKVGYDRHYINGMSVVIAAFSWISFLVLLQLKLSKNKKQNNE